LPLIGTIAILACLAYIGSAGFRVGGGKVDNKHFALIDTSSITTTIGKDVYHGLPDSHDHSKQKDVFAIYLWNYCSGTKTNKEFRINYCSSVKTPFDQYRLWNTWKVDITKGQLKDAKSEGNNQMLEVGVKGITYLPKTIRSLYSGAIAMTVFELIFGFAAIWTRWASFLAAFTSMLATLTLIAGTAMSQILYGALVRSIEKADYTNFRRGTLSAEYGRLVFVVSWIAVIISLATSVCWIFSICCVSTTERKKTGKSKPLSERLAGLGGGHKYEKMEGGEHARDSSYTPYAYKGTDRQ